MKKTYITFSYGYENDELTKILKKDLNELGSKMDIDFRDPSWFLGLKVGKKFY
jgi:hypothetical protein